MWVSPSPAKISPVWPPAKVGNSSLCYSWALLKVAPRVRSRPVKWTSVLHASPHPSFLPGTAVLLTRSRVRFLNRSGNKQQTWTGSRSVSLGKLRRSLLHNAVITAEPNSGTWPIAHLLFIDSELLSNGQKNPWVAKGWTYQLETHRAEQRCKAGQGEKGTEWSPRAADTFCSGRRVLSESAPAGLHAWRRCRSWR